MALYDTNKNLIAGSRKTNIYRCNSFAEYEALPAAEKAKYDYVATPDELRTNLYTLISSVALTTTATDYTLILNRKLSDYDYIIIQQYDSTTMRNSAVIHLNQFKNKRVILNTLHGANTSSTTDYSVSGINVQYVDDTTIRAYATGSALINTIEIMGAKITE